MLCSDRDMLFLLFVAQSFHVARKILVTFAIFAKFADFSKTSISNCRILLNLLFLLFLPYLLLIFSQSKKNSGYFCDFCEICYFFYTFLIAVFFQSFLIKLRKELVSKFLLTRSILDVSDLLEV